VIWSIIVIGVMDLAASFVGNVMELSAVRFVAGLGLGALIPNCATLIAEFTPQRRRAFAVALSLLFIPLGIVLAGYLASIVLPLYGWPALFQAGGIIPLVVAVSFYFVLPESPRYLARAPENRDKVLTLLARMNLYLPEDAAIAEPSAARHRAGLSQLFAPDLRRDTLCLWAMGFFAYMTSYIVLNWAPGMLAGQGLGLEITSKSLSAWSLGGFGSPLIGLAIQRWGSRRAIGGFRPCGSVGNTGADEFAADGGRDHLFDGDAVDREYFRRRPFGRGLCPATHIYPPAFRSTGTGAASALGRLGAMTSAYAGVYSLHLGGPVGYFACMTVTSLLTFAFAMLIRNHVPQRADSATLRPSLGRAENPFAAEDYR
jgi:AAHS family 4-hydroxybenzoate transporter-like MFS transporter